MMEQASQQHIPVLKNKILDYLPIASDAIVVDATYGRGGHSQLFLEQLGPEGRLVAFDRDQTAIDDAHTRHSHDQRVVIVKSSFSELQKALEALGLAGKVTAMLFDLGVSSPQLDNAERGFSFMRDGPLDMRMDQQHGLTAYEWLCAVKESELVLVLKRDGEERFAKRIASAIKRHINDPDYNSTLKLARLIEDAMPVKPKNIHPATRSFQALRIAVNGELEALKQTLPQMRDCLAIGGRVAVISFHSLEDRLVKRFFNRESKGDPFPSDLPIKAELIKHRMHLIGGAVRATEEEVAENRRSRSAVMRVAERLL